MKWTRIWIGIVCLLLAAVCLLDAFHITSPLTDAVGELSVFKMILGVFLGSSVVYFLIKRRVYAVVWTLAAAFAIYESNIAALCGMEDANIINNWVIVGIALLVTIGLKCLLPHRHAHREGWESGSHSMASNSVFIDAATFERRYQENNMGSTVIWFDNVASYVGGGVLHVENNMGSMVVHVPSAWSVDVSIENNMGSVHNRFVSGNGPLLTITGENNMGSIVVEPI